MATLTTAGETVTVNTAEATVPAPDTSFADTINALPYNPSTDEGRGFLPLVIRSVGHILYLVGRYDDTAKSKPTKARAKEEIDGALSHWTLLNTSIGFSEKALTELKTVGDSLVLASEQIEGWEDSVVLENVQKIANRMAQLMANLDREVLGIRDSDAGFNL